HWVTAMMPVMTSTDQPELNIPPEEGRIAIIAGGGALPVAVARTLKAGGHDPFVAVLSGEANVADFADMQHIIISLEECGPLRVRLSAERVSRVVLAGSVERRPKILAMKWNWTLLRLVSRTVAGLVKGDDGLLRSVIAAIEKHGIRVVGAHEIVPDLLAPVGVLTRVHPTKADQRDIDAAAEAALAIGKLDIGQ